LSRAEDGDYQHDIHGTPSFACDTPLATIGVDPIPKRELRMINTDPYKKKKKGLVPVPIPHGEIIQAHPDIVESQ